MGDVGEVLLREADVQLARALVVPRPVELERAVAQT